MKRVIIIISLFVVGLFISSAQERCDTLKLKTTKMYYGTFNGSSFKYIKGLDGVIINMDTLSAFAPAIEVVNVSNDIFSADDEIEVALLLTVHVDTGIIGSVSDAKNFHRIGRDVFPNDTIYITYPMSLNLLGLTNSLKEQFDTELEKVNYWRLMMGISSTSKDGRYSERVLYEGADTSIFRVVRGNVGISEITNYELRVYPNPATNQLRIANYELREGTADYTIYNVVGQTVMQGVLQGRDAINCVSTINVEPLAKGMYYLRIAEKTVKFIKE